MRKKLNFPAVHYKKTSLRKDGAFWGKPGGLAARLRAGQGPTTNRSMETASDSEIVPKRCFFVSFVFLTREYPQSVKAESMVSSKSASRPTVYSLLRGHRGFCQYPYKAHQQ